MKQLAKNVLGIYSSLFSIPPRCKDLNEVTPKSPFACYVINCGANCSQYTLKTMHGYSVLDLFKSGPLEIYVCCNVILFGAKGSYKAGDTTTVVDNDNYNKVYYNGLEIDTVIASEEEWKLFLKAKGYQVNPPRAFAKPTGRTIDFRIFSIKGIIDTNNYLTNIKEEALLLNI